MSICPQAMSCARPSSDVARVSPVTPCFAAVYAAVPGRGMLAEIEPLLMIRPPLGVCRFMSRNACWVQRNVPVRFVASVDVQSANSTSSSGDAGGATPALLKRRSSRPNRASTSANRVGDRRRVADVAGERDRSASDLGRSRLEWLEPSSRENDGEPGLGERGRGGAPDAAAAPGDEGNASPGNRRCHDEVWHRGAPILAHAGLPSRQIRRGAIQVGPKNRRSARTGRPL